MQERGHGGKIRPTMFGHLLNVMLRSDYRILNNPKTVLKTKALPQGVARLGKTRQSSVWLGFRNL
jgi:hypothetical protein